MGDVKVSGASGATASPRQRTGPPRSGPPRSGWIPGLDGLRAIAVIAVVAFHLNTDYLPGGFAGVDVFFVLSGYLITRLLIGEWRRSGRIALGAFYARRARRLLPAVLALLAIVFTVGGTLWPEQRATLPGSSLSSLGYVTNWWLIADEQSYFVATGRPPMLQHLWSLAIEEQYYLAWAPAVIVLLTPAVARRLTVARRQLPLVVAAVALVGALASTVAMWAIAARTNVPFEADSARVYFGTDTHAMGLLLGSAAGAVLAADLPRLRRVAARIPGWASDLVAVAALAGLGWWMLTIDEFSPGLYRGGFLVLSALVLLLVVTAARPSGRIGALLDVRPMRWIGQRSYGIYLWHWPVAVVTRPGLDVTGPAWLIDAARAVLTLVIAALSYRYVEARWRSRRAVDPPVAVVPAPVAGKPSVTFPSGRWFSPGRATAAVGAACVLALVAGHVALSVQWNRADAEYAAAAAEATDTDWGDWDEDSAAEGGMGEGGGDGTDVSGVAAASDESAPTTAADGPAGGLAGPGALAGAGGGEFHDSWDRPRPPDTSHLLVPMTTAAPPPTATDDAAVPPGRTPGSAPASTGATVPAPSPGSGAADDPPPSEGEPGTEPTAEAAADPVPKAQTKKKASKKKTSKKVLVEGKVSAFGDSVMLGAVDVLEAAVPKIAIDAEVGRQAWTTLDKVLARHKKGKLAPTVVIHTGNNGIVSGDQLTKVLKRLADCNRIVLVNDHVDRAWEKPNNKTLKKVAGKFDNVRLVDWHAAATENPGWLTPDGMHLKPSGAKAYAKLIAAAMG